MRREKYRGAEIVVRSLSLRDEKRWRSRVNLELHSGNDVIVTSTVESAATYSSESESLDAGLEDGKKMLDRRADGEHVYTTVKA